MPSGIGYGISLAGASIADAIRRRREASYQNEATRAILNAILAGQQLVDTGTLSPEMAAKLAPLGVDLGGTGAGGDVTRTKEQMLSDLISAVGNKYPALAGQNLGALMAPQQQLVQERQARSTLEGFSPMVSSVLSPEQMQATIAAGNVDPVAMAEMYKNWTNTLITNQAGTEGQQLAELGPSGEKLRERKKIDQKEIITFQTDEQMRSQRAYLAQSEAMQKRLADYRASLEKEKPTTQTETQKGRTFSIMDDQLSFIREIDNQIKGLKEQSEEALVTTNTIDAARLGQQKLPGVTNAEILVKAKAATLAGKDSFETVYADFVNSGRIDPTEDSQKKLKEAIEEMQPSDPGESSVYSLETTQKINKQVQAQKRIYQLEETREKAVGAFVDYTKEARGLLTDPTDIQTYDIKLRAASDQLGVNLSPTATSEDIRVTGVPERFSQGAVGKAASGAAKALGKFSDAIGEDISNVSKFLGGKAPESVAGVKTGAPTKDPRQELLSSMEKQLREAPAELDVVGTLKNIDNLIGEKKLTDEERIRIKDIIIKRNQEVGGGLQ